MNFQCVNQDQFVTDMESNHRSKLSAMVTIYDFVQRSKNTILRFFSFFYEMSMSHKLIISFCNAMMHCKFTEVDRKPSFDPIKLTLNQPTVQLCS